jgi:phenylalanyl-tRNA synthetase beta chain
MKFPLSWLRDYLETDADAGAIADKLTDIGLEVEGIENPGAKLAGFTVAKILSADQHPNADRLHLCMVDDGSGTPLQVVCGAPNARAGIKVVLAKPGLKIPATGDVLKIGAIRGVESRGMMCSERELELSDEHNGIIELPDDAKIGAPAVEALHLSDAIIDINITPNRGDCCSVYGVARDLAAAGMGKLKAPAIEPIRGKFKSPKTVSLDFPVGKEAACPLFAGRFIRGVKNGPSPVIVQEQLKAIGMRPISALVDVSNLISHAFGRPLHVFDASKLKGNVSARLARDGEKLLALDGKAYALDAETIVIADEEKAQSIAGVMGGEETGCQSDTVDVFLESALFDPVLIARTGRKLGLLSDARYRFERGVDPAFVIPGIELATRLILEWCGGEPSELAIAGEAPMQDKTIAFSADIVKRFGGLDVAESEIVRILTALGFAVEGQGRLIVTPPSWRSDVEGEADLVEEVVRIYGLSQVPSVPMERPHAIARPVLTPAQKRVRLARRSIASRGYLETVSFSFIARKAAALFGGGDDTRQLANPIAADLDALRPTPLPSLLAAAMRNATRGANDFALFEIGAGFKSGVPGEQTSIAAGIRVGLGARCWTKDSHPADFFDVKADVLAVLESVQGSPMNAPMKPKASPWYHPGRSAVLALGKTVIAEFGELHPAILAAFDLKLPVAAFELYLDALPEAKHKAKSAFAPSPYQAVERDFAFVAETKVTVDDILRAVKNAERNLIESASLFDVYEGKGVPEGRKSLAISVRLQPKDKTLTDAEIEAVGQKIVAAVAKATGATLRA